MIPVQQAMAFSDAVDIVNREMLERIAKTLAAEVRRLREENERLRKDAEVGAFWIRYPGLMVHAVCDEISRKIVYRVTGSIFTEFFNTPQEAIFAAIDAERGKQ